MKKLAVITVLVFASLLMFAQESTKSDSKWKSTTNGQTYQMEVSATGISGKTTEKPHMSFTIKGDASKLTKITLTNKELYITVLVKENQDMNVAPGHYKFKFHHERIGVQEFEIDLKSGDDKAVILTLK